MIPHLVRLHKVWKYRSEDREEMSPRYDALQALRRPGRASVELFVSVCRAFLVPYRQSCAKICLNLKFSLYVNVNHPQKSLTYRKY